MFISKIINFSRTIFVSMLFSLSIFASNSQQIVTTIPVGNEPSYIVSSPNGLFAYVANLDHKGGDGKDVISVIDLQTNKVVDTIYDPSFDQPYIIVINSSGTKGYVTNSGGTTVSVLDLINNKVVAVIDGFDGPSGIALTPDNRYAYVTNYGNPTLGQSGKGTTINIVNLETNAIIGSAIKTDLAPTTAAMSPTGEFVYILCYVTGELGNGVIDVISTKTNTIVARIPGFFGPYFMVFNSDGTYGYVTNFGSNNFTPYGHVVSVVDLSKNTIVKNISLGVQPSGIAITPDDRLLYVTNYDTFVQPSTKYIIPGPGTMNVINLATYQVSTKVLKTGRSPAVVSLSVDGQRAYVVNYSDNNVTVFDINDKMWL